MHEHFYNAVLYCYIFLIIQTIPKIVNKVKTIIRVCTKSGISLKNDFNKCLVASVALVNNKISDNCLRNVRIYFTFSHLVSSK